MFFFDVFSQFFFFKQGLSDRVYQSLACGRVHSGFFVDDTIYNLLKLIEIEPRNGTQDKNFSPWKQGFGRLSELSIETGFGEMRSFTPNSQLTCRSFWFSSAKRSMRTMRKASLEAKPVKNEAGETKVSAQQFLVVCEIPFCLLFLLAIDAVYKNTKKKKHYKYFLGGLIRERIPTAGLGMSWILFV